jgi:hypothetical protein
MFGGAGAVAKKQVGRAVTLAIVAALAFAACGGSSKASTPRPSAGSGDIDGITPAQLAEARRLLDPDHEPKSPTLTQVECVAQAVVLQPTIDEIAEDMAQIENKDLRQLVMTDYLNCAYNFVLDLYMRFAPSDISPQQKVCIRSKFTQLNVNRLSEVMVEDPDAGYTGPLVIHACQTGSKTNPLLHGTLPSMGSS